MHRSLKSLKLSEKEDSVGTDACLFLERQHPFTSHTQHADVIQVRFSDVKMSSMDENTPSRRYLSRARMLLILVFKNAFNVSFAKSRFSLYSIILILFDIIPPGSKSTRVKSRPQRQVATNLKDSELLTIQPIILFVPQTQRASGKLTTVPRIFRNGYARTPVTL